MERTDISTESDAPNDAPDAPEADETPEAGDAPDLPTVAGALSRCVREALERGEPTEVPGLGAFRVEHRSSQMEEPEEGGFSISPPRDEIVFEPAEE
jgi:nucleoid DNA-binding protein